MNKIVHYIGLDVHKETIAVYRAGELTAIHVPDQEEAIRDRTSAHVPLSSTS